MASTSTASEHLQGLQTVEANHVFTTPPASLACGGIFALDYIKMNEYKFLIPSQRDSDRKWHAQTSWEWLDKQLLALFHGYTEQTGFIGRWKDDSGKVIADGGRVFYVASHSSTTLDTLLEEAKGVFDQQCIYRSQSGSQVHFI